MTVSDAPVSIDHLDDPRLVPYRNLKDRELARDGQRFIAEGEMVVRRLLTSDFPVESVLLAERRAAELLPIVPTGIPVYLVGNERIHEIIGFKFHSGVMAVGRRKPRIGVDAFMTDRSDPAKPLTLVILPEIANAENMGAMIRISSAFGVDGVVLGERSCDPFWRQAVRVSMGNVFRVPILHSDDLADDLRRLRQQWGVQLIASVLDPAAESLGDVRRADRLGILFGNEAQGLTPIEVDTCDRKVTIPMELGTDSLNVAIAAAVFLFHFTQAKPSS